MAIETAHHNIPAAPPKPREYEDIPNPRSDAVDYYTPAQVPVAGTALSENPPAVFTPLKIRGMEMQNRVIVSFFVFGLSTSVQGGVEMEMWCREGNGEGEVEMEMEMEVEDGEIELTEAYR